MRRRERLMQSSRWPKALLWGCVLAVAAVIFLFSSQSGEESQQTSLPAVKLAPRVLAPEHATLPPRERTSLLMAVSYLVRKLAHLTEFAALGFFVRMLLGSYHLPRHSSSRAWLAGTLYAALDELHQWILGTRIAMWQDVALDSVGVLAGVTVAYAVLTLRARRRARRAAPVAPRPDAKCASLVCLPSAKML